MSKAAWFIVGLVAGELCGRWFVHIFYLFLLAVVSWARFG